MSTTLTATLGFDGAYDLFLPDRDGAPFDLAGRPLDAIAWRGDAETPLFAPAVVAIPDQPGYATLSWAAAQIAGLEPGLYPVVVGVMVEGRRDLGFEGFLEVSRGPGTRAIPRVYSSEDDLLIASDQLPLILGDAGLAAGLDVRGEAREEVDRRIADGYCPVPGLIRRRSATWDPIVGHEVPDFATIPPDRDAIKALLAANRLVVDERLRELCSWWAASLVLGRQETGGRNAYRDEAESLRVRFEAAWHRYRPRPDLDGDGVADLEIGRGDLLYLSEAS